MKDFTKKILFTIVMIITIVPIAICTTDTVTLYVCKIDWYAWSDLHQTREYQVIEHARAGVKYKFGEVIYGDAFSIKIKKITDDGVQIETSINMVDMEKNIWPTYNSFTVPRDKELKIATPSFDAGTVFIISLSPIEPESNESISMIKQRLQLNIIARKLSNKFPETIEEAMDLDDTDIRDFLRVNDLSE